MKTHVTHRSIAAIAIIGSSSLSSIPKFKKGINMFLLYSFKTTVSKGNSFIIELLITKDAL